MVDVGIGWGIGYQVEGEEHILRTSDGGATWQDASPPAGEASPGSPAALFIDAQTAWAAYPAAPGQPAVVWRTADGGVTWLPAPLPISGEAEFFSPSFFAADGEKGWLLVTVGAGMQHAYSDLYTTQDDGVTWTKIADPFSPAAADLMLLPHTGMAFEGDTGWVTKENGVMDGDVITTEEDTQPGRPLIRPVMRAGRLVSPLPGINALREHAASQLAALPGHLRRLEHEPPYPVAVADALRSLAEEVDARRRRMERS
ncbi:MAG: hypothetical protein R8K47_06620 [Mariprofundaceae bacterium]